METVLENFHVRYLEKKSEPEAEKEVKEDNDKKEKEDKP